MSAKENLHPLMDMGRSITTKDQEKAEVLSDFFALDFSRKSSGSLGTQPPELVDREGEGKEVPELKGEMVYEGLDHSDSHKSMGVDGIHSGVLKKLSDLTEPLSIVFQQSLLTSEISVD